MQYRRIWVCRVQASNLPNKVHSVTFTMNDVQYDLGFYDPTANTDPDDDSNGTQITVTR